MANRTDKEAAAIRGTNPQHLVEKITRSKIYNSMYWKEYCFALNAETIVDKAMELKAVGGNAFVCSLASLMHSSVVGHSTLAIPQTLLEFTDTLQRSFWTYEAVSECSFTVSEMWQTSHQMHATLWVQLTAEVHAMAPSPILPACIGV
jgi:hypothetical protein